MLRILGNIYLNNTKFDFMVRWGINIVNDPNSTFELLPAQGLMFCYSQILNSTIVSLFSLLSSFYQCSPLFQCFPAVCSKFGRPIESIQVNGSIDMEWDKRGDGFSK